MDLATIIGLIGGMTCIVMVMVSGGDWKVFLHVESMVIVYGGMFFATMVHFSLPQVFKLSMFIKKTLLYKLPSEKALIQKLVTYSAINRRDGALALERQIPDAGDSFLVSSAAAMGMVATLIGRVQMLGTMNDPSKIGAGMSVALIGTFHGALGAN